MVRNKYLLFVYYLISGNVLQHHKDTVPQVGACAGAAPCTRVMMNEVGREVKNEGRKLQQ